MPDLKAQLDGITQNIPEEIGARIAHGVADLPPPAWLRASPSVPRRPTSRSPTLSAPPSASTSSSPWVRW